MITTNSGQTVAVYEYDVYGMVESVKNAYGTTITSLSHIGLLNPMRYRGYCYDNETGLYYLISRYYDPTTGRFVNADGLVPKSLVCTALKERDHIIAETPLEQYLIDNCPKGIRSNSSLNSTKNQIAADKLLYSIAY